MEFVEFEKLSSTYFSIRQEMLKVKIFYEELNYQEIQEKVSYDVSKILEYMWFDFWLIWNGRTAHFSG